jgi:hypothetical protein
LASTSNVNADLKLPSLSPEWLSIAVGMILSTGNKTVDRYLFASSPNVSPLLNIITTFLEEWLNSTSIATFHTRSTTINFSLPTDDITDVSHRCVFILEHILIPLLPCHIIVNKIYSCRNCQSIVNIHNTVTSIPVNVLRTGLHLEHDLHGFFASNTSDILCTSCNKSTTRHVEVLQWPQILIVNVNESQRNVKFRKPPGVLSLAQFSS